MPNADTLTTETFKLCTCFILIGHIKNSDILLVFTKNHFRIIFELELSIKDLLLNQRIL